MAACTIFDEDEVCMPLSNGGFKYGLVVESSEYISSDEDDDDEEDRVQRGTVKIAWHPNGNETVVSENKAGDAMVGYLHPEMTRFLKMILSKFVDMREIKAASNITEVNFTDVKKQHSDDNLAVGMHARGYISSNEELKPRTMETFFKSVREFYIELADRIIQKFPFDDTTLKALAFLNPDLRCEVRPASVTKLAQRFTAHISVEKATEEFEDLCLADDDELPEFRYGQTSLNEYWNEVSQLILPNGKQRYNLISTVAFACLSLPHSNADTERVFSRVRKIQTDYRGQLAHATLENLLAVRINLETECYATSPSAEMIRTAKKLILADRSLMPGDIVRRLISGRYSQRGFVQNMHVKCHLKILGTEQYIYNVDVHDVKPIQEWDLEPDVTLDSWVGHVMEVNEELTLKFPDGAKCKVNNANILNLEDVHDKRETHSEFHMKNFYPGQELHGSVDDFEEAIWIQGTRLRGPKKLGNRGLYNVPVVVEKVETKSVDVRWMCKGFTKTGAGVDKLVYPPVSVEREDLKRMKRLDCFDFCHRQIGDKGYYTIKETDVLVPNLTPRKYATPDVLDKISKGNGIVLGASANGLVVLRQDSQDSKDTDLSGKSESDVTSHEDGVVHINGDFNETNDDNDVGACEDGLEGSDNDSDVSEASSSHSTRAEQKQNTRKAVSMRIRRKHKGRKAKKKHKRHTEVKAGDCAAVEIFYTFSQCDVMWQDGSIEVNISSPELFPIHHLDELEFFPGDFVVESKGTVGTGNTATEYGIVTSCDHKERTVMVKWMKPYQGDNSRPEEKEAVELSVYDIKDHSDYKFRSGHTVIRIGGFEENNELEAVGQVFRLDPSGVIHVWWPDGTVTQNYPQDLYIISEEFNSEDGSSDEWTDLDEEEEEEEEDETDSDASWETEEEVDTDEEKSQDDRKLDAKKKPVKQPWLVNDKKKKDLDELLQRLQGSVSGLLNVFLNVPGPFFKNSKQVFQDILAIFKRCKELEKILKSSFFEDDEISDLISEIKEQLRKEKTTKLVKHVTSLYQTRTCGNIQNGVNQEAHVVNSSEKDEVVQDTKSDNIVKQSSQSPVEESTTLKGAEGEDIKNRSGKVIEAETLRKALIDYGSNITDPLLQIIFDTSLHLTVANSANGKASEVSKSEQISGEKLLEMCHNTQGSHESEVTSKSTDDLVNNPSDIVKKLKSVCSDIEDNESLTKEANQELDEFEKKTKALSGTVQGVQGAEGNKEGEAHKEMETNFPVGHRNLCIRVCKALSPRLLYIQQEITRRWLAHKFGCDKDATAIEVIEEMQLKMIESVESGNGPLKLFSDEDVMSEVMAENVKDLEKLTETRDLESENVRESSVEKTKEDSLTDPVPDPVSHMNGTGYVLCEETPANHRFKNHPQKPANLKAFHGAVNKELMLLQSSLPDGIIVKSFEDRMDLFSVLIKGPANTPYEDGLFAFDIQLPANYPSSPPVFHYLSFCSERLNPNLYEDGKVCVSLLGTWTGKGNEVWTSKSNLLQVLVSIQGLILVNEPYFNEAGYEKQRSTQHGQENSRMYNEMAILKLIQSMSKMALNPPAMFISETEAHLQSTALRMISRVEHWIELSKRERCLEERPEVTVSSTDHPPKMVATIPQSQENGVGLSGPVTEPDFPLLPASKGFCLTVTKYLEIYKNVLSEHILRKPLHNS